MSDLDQPGPQQLLEEAKALQGLGEHAEAVGLLQRVVEQGGDWEARFRYANSLAVDGQVEKAYEVWREVVALPEWSPNQVQGELAGQFTEAMRHVSFETTVDVDDPKSAYLQAKVAQLFDQPDVVKHALIKTLTRGHDYEDTLEWLMRLFQQEGQHEEALKLVEPLLMQVPNSPALTYWAGELNHLTGRTAVAVRILANAVKLDPNRWQAHARLAEIYAAQHRFEEADAAYEAALGLNPDDFDLVMGSVEAAKRQYQFERAQALLEKATQLKPGDLQVQIEFAQLSFQMGAMAKAVPGLELALRESPDDPQLVANLARAYYGTGQYEKAAPMLANALQKTPDGELAYLCARSLAELKQRPQALEALKKAVELSPDRAQYQSSLGKELLSLGQTEEALKALSAAANLEPQNAMAQLTVAGLYKKVGQTKAAMDSYLRASALEPERIEVHLQIGVLGLTCDRLDEAANAFIEVLRLSPTPHPMALAGVAQIYQRRGLSEVAVDFYRQALQANPGLTAAAQAVSVIFAKDKDIEGLLGFLTDLLDFFKGRPDDARAMVSAFSTYLESKGLIGFCTEVAALFAERFPSPEAGAERARLFMLRAEQLQSKGDAVRAYHILQRLHGFEPKPELAVRLEAMRTALGSAVETRPTETPASPAPAAESVLDSILPPVPVPQPAVVEAASSNGVANSALDVAPALTPAVEEPVPTQLEADKAEATGEVRAPLEQPPAEVSQAETATPEASDSQNPDQSEGEAQPGVEEEQAPAEVASSEGAAPEPRADLAQPGPSTEETEEEPGEATSQAVGEPEAEAPTGEEEAETAKMEEMAAPDPADQATRLSSNTPAAEPDAGAAAEPAFPEESGLPSNAEPAPPFEGVMDAEPAPLADFRDNSEPAISNTAQAEPETPSETSAEEPPFENATDSQSESLSEPQQQEAEPEAVDQPALTTETEPAPVAEAAPRSEEEAEDSASTATESPEALFTAEPAPEPTLGAEPEPEVPLTTDPEAEAVPIFSAGAETAGELEVDPVSEPENTAELEPEVDSPSVSEPGAGLPVASEPEPEPPLADEPDGETGSTLATSQAESDQATQTEHQPSTAAEQPETALAEPEPESEPEPVARVELEESDVKPVPVAQVELEEPDVEPVPVAQAELEEPDVEPVPVTQAGAVEADAEPLSTAQVEPEALDQEPVHTAQVEPEALDQEPVPTAQVEPEALDQEPVPAAQVEPEARDQEPLPTEQATPTQPDPEPIPAASHAAEPLTLPAPLPPSRFVRERLFELRAHSHRPTQQHIWERSLGEYLLASASSRAYKQPRELDEETADELCDIYLESAKILRDAGWLEQSCGTLSTALLYNPQHEAVLTELEDTVLEWVEFLDEEEAYEQAVMLLEGQWERRPGDRLRSRARALFGSWANAMRQEGDHYGAEALEAHWSTRMQYWEQLRAQWAARPAGPWPPAWQKSE